MDLEKIYKIILALALVANFGCTEPFAVVTESFEDALVIEATLTDEYKTQQIRITRTFLLESSTPILEENANVKIEDSNNNIFNFNYVGDGIYNSVKEFQAIEGVSYKLIVVSTDGRSYTSENEFLAAKAAIDKLNAEPFILDDKVGIQVFVDSNENLGDANYFRYEYVETYKIIAPFYYANDANPINVSGSGNSITYDLDIVPRPEDQKICYSTNYSNDILVTNVNGLSEDRISRFPIRFINSDDHILRDRYSILVKQYVQSVDANNFYKIINDLSSDENLLIDKQPGFVSGNIFSNNNPNDRVVGFFDVSSVTSKRIYFNHTDFNFSLPPYFYDCEVITLDYNKLGPPNERLRLYDLLTDSGMKYYDGRDTEYRVVQPQCGDCTSFASNIKPEFWED